MYNHFKFLFLILLVITSCSNSPSTEEIENDINILEKEITETMTVIEKYSGGLLADLVNVRLETLKSTKAMLEQKRTGIRRFIPIKYSIDGNKYSPPIEKNDLLQEIIKDIENLKVDLTSAQNESEKYAGGLLNVLSLTQITTIENSIAFLEQKRLLLKHDIPYYSMIPSNSSSSEPAFKPTPGEDIDKF